jgi:hypothetical protein
MSEWTRWFAWRPVHLQINGRVVWWRWVEYEQIREGRPTGAFGSGPRTITHYRLAS